MKKSTSTTSRHQQGRRRGSGMGILFALLAIFVGAVGLVNILTKNKTYAIGRQQEKVEREIAALSQELRSLDMKIEEALSRDILKARLSTRGTKLKSIHPDNIVLIPPVVTETLTSLP